jgi:hypothetical protein
MDVITYSLRDDEETSDQYYRDVVAFTDEVLAEAEGRVGWLVEAFQSHVRETGRDVVRSFSEYAFEFLAMGVLWQVYASAALDLAEVPRWALTGLVRLRQQGGCLKPGADFLRGMLAAIFLSVNGRHSTELLTPTLSHLDRLLGWLAATDCFSEEVERLRAWQGFLAGRLPEEAAAALAAALAFADWFETCGEAVLGRYTPHVEQFLAETHPSYGWREDAIFCGRRRVEYHLNMVGTEVLNRAFREAFLGTARKVVLLPPCMKARPDDTCQAHPTPFGARCAGCTPGCHVQQVTRLGEEHGFETLILPEELRVFSDGGVKAVTDGSVGIVGVSCVLTNASGGWETRRLGVAAQGVPLDYCGCSYHWHEEGLPTDVDVSRLLRVLGVGQSQLQEVVDGERGQVTVQPR